MKIVIGICTYHRTDGLRALLNALEHLRLAAVRDDQVIVVVVDNSQRGGARHACTGHSAGGRFPLVYHHEARRGLTFARNRVLDAAIELAATHLASIDDDEVPEPGWLEQLVLRLDETNATVVLGPVRPLFQACPPDWLPLRSYCTDRAPVHGFVTDGYMGNAMIRLAPVVEHKIRFDPRFNGCGGEDTAFFASLRNLGHRLAWSDDAVVHETVPIERMSARWLLRRWRATGFNEALIIEPEAKQPAARLRNLMRAMARLTIGSCRAVGVSTIRGWTQPEAALASCYTLMRGVGFLQASLGLGIADYLRPRSE